MYLYIYIYIIIYNIYIWVFMTHILTHINPILIMVSNGNHPQIALIQGPIANYMGLNSG
jgi:hypothetical protein